MASSRIHQAVSSQALEHWEPPMHSDASDAVHYGFTLHCILSSCQHQEDSFNQTLNFHAPLSQFPFTRPHNIQPWNTQVDRPPTLDHRPPYFSNCHQASLTSSITQPPLPVALIGEVGQRGGSEVNWSISEGESTGQWSTSVNEPLRWGVCGTYPGAQGENHITFHNQTFTNV